MKKQRLSVGIVLSAAVVCGCWLSGCGSPSDSGANSKTTVKLKPSREEQPQSATGNGGETETDDGGAPAGGTGTLRGVVVYDGTPPELSFPSDVKIKPDERDVCKPDVIGNRTLMVHEAGGRNVVEHVFVYLDRAPSGGSSGEPEAKEIKFDNVNCTFEPHSLFCRVGQKVLVTNSDPIAHNTHTLPVRNQEFNSVINMGQEIPIEYTQAERLPVGVKCDFHAWMKAYHLVLDHPYGGVSNEQGEFVIEGLPVGKHSFRVWHETAGYLDRNFQVDVQPGENTVELEFVASKFEVFNGPQPKTLIIANSR